MHAAHPRVTALARLVTSVLTVFAATAPASAQRIEITHELTIASHIVMPQARAFPIRPGAGAVAIESVDARVSILEQTASTTMQIVLRNSSSVQSEAVLLLPVPDGAVVSSFLFDGAASEPTARVLAREEARRLYDEIVNRVRDPALLEFAGYNLIRSSVFPVPAGGVQKVRVTYENILSAGGNRIDYVLPRSESLERPSAWRVAVDIQAKHPISTVYSPSHELFTERVKPGHIRVKLAPGVSTAPGPFRISYLLERNGVTASLLAYPDPVSGGGYFLLIAGLPASIADQPHVVKREVTIVIDRSGSMAGAKIDQARAAATQVVEGLAEGESFNIIDYSTTVSSLARRPVVKSPATTAEARKYIAAMRPGGGTNIHDALVEALNQPATAGTLPLVLFLTDGLPTVGRTSETTIRELVVKGNPHQRRAFVFGVGHDVNVPLLDRLADATRATATYVLPEEDVEVKVAQVFKRLYGPVLAGPAIDDVGELRRIHDLMPVNIPDLFEGDQLVVLGRYRDGSRPLTIQLNGDFLGQRKRYEFAFDLSAATTRNAFVPRLWASRRIAYLVDLVRQAGAEAAGRPTPASTTIFDDPRNRELRDEILRLSTEFGILTEYTAFLATEGTNLGDWKNLAAQCGITLDARAVKSRSGAEAINQGLNYNAQKEQSVLNYQNGYVDEKLNRVEIANVQQVCDRAFFKRGQQWIDSRLVSSTAQRDIQPDAVVEYGSPEHLRILSQLVSESRQGVLSLHGDILLQLDGRNVLIRNRID